MSFEPFFAFFIIWKMRQSLKLSSQLPEWIKLLKGALYFVGGLTILDLVASNEGIITWIWKLLLFLIIVVVFTRPEFHSLRTLMFAFIPLIAISVVIDALELFEAAIFKNLANYLEYTNPLAFIWMIAMLIIFHKQQKVLEKERKEREKEEEEHRIIAAQKAELEVMVAERTAELTQQKDELEKALNELKTTQFQLIRSEKMASLGELTAGIAHEIQNPLNFVNNFSEVNTELLAEMKTELLAGNTRTAISLAEDIEENEKKIIHHGKRADGIVKGMLQHSRTSTGQKEPTDINALADEYLRLSYHGLRAKDKSFNAIFKTEFDESIGKIEVAPQDIGRVLLNLYNNAFYAVNEKKKVISNLNGSEQYNPTVVVRTKKVGSIVFITVYDNGAGIPEKALSRIFQPFFTTKPTGQGTGLGLSLSYDTIKAHGGEIKVKTVEGTCTEFTIELPVA